MEFITDDYNEADELLGSMIIVNAAVIIFWPSVGRWVDRHLSQVSQDIVDCSRHQSWICHVGFDILASHSGTKS